MKKGGPTNAKERQKKRAKSLLDRMRPLGPDDPAEAHRIKVELEKIAEHGYEREISVRAPRNVSVKPRRNSKKK